MLDAVVIGGGVAGLAAARALKARRLEVVVLEARDRLGGRVWTRRDGRSEVPIELGAEFVHGKPPGLLRLARQARLRLRDADGEHWVVEGRRVSLGDDRMMRAMALFSRVADEDGALGPFLRRATRGHPELWPPAKLFGEGLYAADLSRASARATGLQAMGAQRLHGDVLARVVDGYDGLPTLRAGAGVGTGRRASDGLAAGPLQPRRLRGRPRRLRGRALGAGDAGGPHALLRR